MSRNRAFESFPIPVCLFQSSETDLSKEMEHFYVVNKRQKSVPTDLAQQLLYEKYSLQGPRVFFDFLNRINARLNERLTGLAVSIVIQLRNYEPWRNLIRSANQLRREGLIPQRTMADSIGRYVLKNDSEFMQAYEELLHDPADGLKQRRLENRLNQVANYLKDYWRALSRIFEGAFTHPEEYSIQRSTGVYVFHRIFSGIYPPDTLPPSMTPVGVRHHCQRRGFSLAVMEDVLRHMFQNATRASEFGRAVNDEFWHKGRRRIRPRGDPLARATNQRDIGQLSGRFGRHLPPLPA